MLPLSFPWRKIPVIPRTLVFSCSLLFACLSLAFCSLFACFILALALPLAAQQPAQQQPAHQPGGPNSGPAPAPPSLPADALQHPGVPQGTLTGPLTLRSQVYDGMVSDYWIYVPAQYDPKTPAPYMVFQDGGGYAHRDGDHPALNVLDNLIAEHKIPVIIAVFTNPGDISASPGAPTYQFVEAYGKKWDRGLKDSMRSTEYDTVSDRYDRFLHDELIPEVAQHYNLRTDAYSHAITGLSSGGICAFNAAWQHPEYFSRVLSWIGSFTSIQWHEDPSVPDGGQDYPEKILREDHRNIRVWLQDGSNDQENPKYGSWPMANIRMANALKLKGYDFHFSFGKGPHTAGEGGAEFPEEMIWLWRDYDPAKTDQTFTQDPAESTKPPFRVAIVNR
jgi:enterochelin esterase family protein